MSECLSKHLFLAQEIAFSFSFTFYFTFLATRLHREEKNYKSVIKDDCHGDGKRKINWTVKTTTKWNAQIEWEKWQLQEVVEQINEMI